MLTLVLLMIPFAAVVSAVGVGIARRAALKVGAIDTAPMPGQTKEASRRIPNVGGVGIVWAILSPLVVGLIGIWTVPVEWLPIEVAVHLAGARAQTALGVSLAVGLAVVHILGLIDDRKPLGPRVKLGVMTIAVLLVTLLPPVITGDAHSGTRLLTLLDAFPGGWWLSAFITLLWFLAVINAMNFIDNMDGLSAGVATIAASCFLVSAILSGQWFVAGVLGLVVGACLGFLPWNYPRAKCFMGDGGSLSIGFLLAFLTARTTYVEPGYAAGGWYGVLVPLLVLAVPLYDLVVVSGIRLKQGKSPMVGDLQHLSHRLVRRGLSKPSAVAVIWGFAAAIGLPAIGLGRLNAWQALLVGGQAVVLLATIAALEWASSPKDRAGDPPEGTSV